MRLSQFIDGLNTELRRKALQFCLDNKWQFSTDNDDDDQVDLDRDHLSKYILAKADLSRLESTFDSERALRDRQLLETRLFQSSPSKFSPMETEK